MNNLILRNICLITNKSFGKKLLNLSNGMNTTQTGIVLRCFNNYANFNKQSTPNDISKFVGTNELNQVESLSKTVVSPYTLYMKKQLKQALTNKNSEKKVTDIMTECSKEWKVLKPEEKLPYLEEANQKRIERDTKLEEIYSKLNKSQLVSLKETLKQKRTERRKYLSKFRLRKEKNELKKPRKPKNAFLLYTDTLDRGDAPVTEFAKGASHKWKALPEQDKQKFIQQSNELLENYQKELKVWEMRMIGEGKKNLIRKRVVKSFKREITSPEKVTKKKAKGRKEKNVKKTAKSARTARKSKKQATKRRTKKVASQVKKTEKKEKTSKTSKNENEKKNEA